MTALQPVNNVKLNISRVFHLEAGSVEKRVDGRGNGWVFNVWIVDPSDLTVTWVGDEKKFASNVDR